MTGFGAGSAELGGLTIRTEIRAVNHRHLLVKTRLPAEFAHLESDVDGLLRKKLQRGAVTVSIQVTRTESPSNVTIHAEVAKRYQALTKKLQKELGLSGELSLPDLMGLPGVVGSADQGAAGEREAKAVLKCVGQAASSMIAMREVEGDALAKDLEKNAKAVEKLVARIDKQMPKIVKAHHENLQRRVSDLLGKAGSVDSADLARELALLADKLDVSEEVSRLDSHLGQLRTMLGKGGSIGRKLDFLAQEFFREANTIGSKCNDADVAHMVVDLKTYIERMREQVQNVE